MGARSHLLRKIESFVKRPDTDPVQALILTLMLYWGFSIMELTTASLEIHDSQMWIILHRQKLSPKRQTYYREQI